MNLVAWAVKHHIPLDALTELKQGMGLLSADMQYSTSDVTPTSEMGVTRVIRLEAARKGILLFRNNVGCLIDGNENFVRFGLANDSAAMNKSIKSSDLVGITPDGQFICREVKAPDWQYTGTPREVAQLKFIELILSKGGDASFATGEGTIK